MPVSKYRLFCVVSSAHTKKLEKRYAEHCAGSAGRTTSLDPPVSLVYSEEHDSFYINCELIAEDYTFLILRI